MNWYKSANLNITIEHQVLDEEGQTHPRGIVSAYDYSIRQEVGNLLYSIYNDKLDIDNVEILPKYRRQGLATRMIQFLLAEYPELTLMPQIVSPDGSQLFKSLREKKIVSRTKENRFLAAAAGGNAWEMTRKDYYNNEFIGGQEVPIQITDDISDYQTLNDILRTLVDGYYVVGDHIVQVQNKQAKTIPDLHAEFDYKNRRYNVIRRSISDRPTFFHGTRGQVSRASELKPGGDHGPLGPNRYRAIYITQDPRDADSYKWGDKGQVLSLRLKPNARIATHQEANQARRQRPDLQIEDAIRAAGFAGVGMKNRRGDYSEIALLDASAIEEHDPHRDEVARALASGLSVPEHVLKDYGDLRPKTALSFSAIFCKAQDARQNIKLGYKVVGWNGQRAYSLYKPSMSYDIRVGATHDDLFLGTSEQFCLDYYTGGTDDQDMLLTYEYNIADVVSGEPDHPNGEVRVRRAVLRESRVLPDTFK